MDRNILSRFCQGYREDDSGKVDSNWFLVGFQSDARPEFASMPGVRRFLQLLAQPRPGLGHAFFVRTILLGLEIAHRVAE
jgi:hypothetical protein